MITILETKLEFCPLCEKEHLVDLVEDKECEIIFKGQKIIYPAKFYICNQTTRKSNTFSTGEMLDQELKTIRFISEYCNNCGSQRCEGVNSEWFEGCKYKDFLNT